MAAYTTLDNVNRWMPNGARIDDQSPDPPDSDTVTALWIPQYQGAIDAQRALVGKAAITDADELSAVDLCLSRELAYQAMAVRSAVNKETEPALYVGWHEEYMAWFNAIVPPSADAGGGVVTPSAATGDGPVFTRSQARNW
jgi:hypothetical protein